MNRKKIFITGGAGFIGANLVKFLLDKGCSLVTVYDNLSCGSRNNLKQAIKDSRQKADVKFIRGDILDFNRLNISLKGHNTVVHLAAHTRVIESLENPEDNFRINSTVTFNVLEASRKNKIKKFIFASSNAAVGEQTPPIDERMIPRPLSPYGASKLCGEALCSAYFHSYGLKAVSLRFANAYGPYAGHKTSVVAKFIKRVKEGLPLEIYGDGEQTRDFIHARDICQAISLCIFNNYFFGNNGIGAEVFQIATGKATRIVDLVKTIKMAAKPSVNHEIQTRIRGVRRGEIRKNYSDITKARNLLGFNPRIELQKGIEDLMSDN